MLLMVTLVINVVEINELLKYLEQVPQQLNSSNYWKFREFSLAILSSGH